MLGCGSFIYLYCGWVGGGQRRLCWWLWQAEVLAYVQQVAAGCWPAAADGGLWEPEREVFARGRRETAQCCPAPIRVPPATASRLCCPRCPCPAQRGWEVSDGCFVFRTAGAGAAGAGDAMQEDRPAAATAGATPATGLAAQDLINHCLTYAKELERIV